MEHIYPNPQMLEIMRLMQLVNLKRKYAIGVTLTEEELNDPKVYSKLEYLATRHTKYSGGRVTLFLGVPKELFNKVKICLKNLTLEAQKNIKVVAIGDENKLITH